MEKINNETGDGPTPLADAISYILRRYTTRQRAAYAIGISNPALSVILNGYRPPTRNEWVKLAAALGDKLCARLFGEAPKEKPQQPKEWVPWEFPREQARAELQGDIERAERTPDF